jgi:hypothetical protein
MRAALSPTASARAVLQRPLPGGGAEMVAMEGPGEIPSHADGQTEAEWTRPALPGARPEPETTRERGRCGGREVITRIFFRSFLRPAGLLRGVWAQPEITIPAFLLEGVPTGVGARPEAGAALEGGAGRVNSAGKATLRRQVSRRHRAQGVGPRDRSDILTALVRLA